MSGGVLALVPARGGSKGGPGKNLRPLAGRSLLEYTAAAAHESGVVDRIVLSTDSDEIADAGRACGLDRGRLDRRGRGFFGLRRLARLGALTSTQRSEQESRRERLTERHQGRI